MSHDARQHSSAGDEPLIIVPGSAEDLPAITDILNYTIMNSNGQVTVGPRSRFPVAAAVRRRCVDHDHPAQPSG
jgi:hypothetical protein